MKINVVALGDSVAQKNNDRSCCVGTFDFVFVCVAVRFFLLCALCNLCLLPCHTRCSFTDVLSCTPTGVSEINHLT